MKTFFGARAPLRALLEQFPTSDPPPSKKTHFFEISNYHIFGARAPKFSKIEIFALFGIICETIKNFGARAPGTPKDEGPNLVI